MRAESVPRRMWHSLLLVALPRDLSYAALAVMLVSSRGLQGAGLAYLAAQTLGAALTIALARSALVATPRVKK